MKTLLRVAIVSAALTFGAAPSLAKAPVPADAMVNPDFGVPVFPYDITDRPYEVVGEVKAGVRKATIFSKAPDQAKIYRELWERAAKLGADAVIKAQYGDAHITALSWGSVGATGVAVKFTGPAVTTAASAVEAQPASETPSEAPSETEAQPSE